MDLVRRLLRQALLALRLAFHSTIGARVLPDGKARLSRARRARAYQELRGSLATRSKFDLAVLSSIANDDEYGIVERMFMPEDVIVDVGAHIGAFSWLCHRRGSRAIFAFEPDPETFTFLEENVGSLPGVSLHRRAVFRSDVASQPLRLSPIADGNTGSPTVLFGGLSFGDAATPEHPLAGRVVPTVSLDGLLEELESVRLLKIDCEGSEFPILLTSNELRRVDEIIGEYHEVDATQMSGLAPLARLAGEKSYRRERLAEHLAALGFEVVFTTPSGTLGIFHAVRRRNAASA